MSSRFENLPTQPLRIEPLFNNPEALVEGWYPLCASRDLRLKQVRSFLILKQRLAVWRGADGELRAIDAFCPHMGADLGHGKVDGNHLRCYFHQWKFCGEGRLTDTAGGKTPVKAIANRSYPVRDHLSYVWIYAGDKVRTPLLRPPGLETGPVHTMKLAEFDLYAHHHVMAAGGIDLQHFATVHNVNVNFQAEYRALGDHVYEWKISGKIPLEGWRGRLGRFLFGADFFYRVRLGAGSMISISYADRLHVVWGCLPSISGISRVKVFSVVPLQKKWRHLLTMALLAVLKDDDSKAFPNMRFQASNPMLEDKTVMQLIQAINHMPESPWTEKAKAKSKDSVLNIGL